MSSQQHSPANQRRSVGQLRGTSNELTFLMHMQQLQSQFMFSNASPSVQLRSIDEAPRTSNGNRQQIPQLPSQLLLHNAPPTMHRERPNSAIIPMDSRMEDLLRRAAEEAMASLDREQHLEAANKSLRGELQKVKQQLEQESGARLRAEQQLTTANERISLLEARVELGRAKERRNALETEQVQNDQRADTSQELEHSSTEPPSEQSSREEFKDDDTDALMKAINSVKTEVIDELYDQIAPTPKEKPTPTVAADQLNTLESPLKSEAPHHRTPLLCNGYNMYRSFKKDGLQTWQCRWIHLGCRGRAQCDVGSSQLVQVATHNHAPNKKPSGQAGDVSRIPAKMATRASLRPQRATKAPESGLNGRILRSSMQPETLQKKSNYALKSNVVGSKPPVKRTSKIGRVGVKSSKNAGNKEAKQVPNVITINGHEMHKYRLHFRNGRLSTGWHCRWRFEDPACPAFIAADLDTMEMEEVEPHNHPAGEKPRRPVPSTSSQ